MMRVRYPLVAFDHYWTFVAHHDPNRKTLHEACGSDSGRRAQVVKAALSGELSYAEWFSEDIAMLQDAGARYEDVVRVVEELSAVSGAHDLLRDLRSAGAKIVIISGGIEAIVEHVFGTFTFDAVLINRLQFDEGGRLIGGVPTPYDRDHKAAGLEYLAGRFGFTMQETCFIGDGPNDISVAKAAALAIAWGDADEGLRAVADHHVQGESLDALRPYLFSANH